MAARIDDAERVRKIREYNRQASARRRVKLTQNGKAQLLCWIPETVRQRLDSAAAAQSRPLNDIVSELLSAALDTYHHEPATTTTPPRNASNDATLDMFSKPETATMDYTGRDEPATPSRVIQSDKDALMNEVGAMLESGLSGGEIARRWNSEGRRTASGAEYIGANILRDYRKWQMRNEK